MKWYQKDFLLGESVYVIAEVGNNHNGSLEMAYRLVDAAKAAGADCVKFQLRDTDSLYRSASKEQGGEDLGAEYIFDLLKKVELSWEQHKELRNYVRDVGLDYLCTPWDIASLDYLEVLDVDSYKVASADFCNLPLIGRMIRTTKPLILSTGMTRSDEIDAVTHFLSESSADFALLHCNSTYPAPFPDINLRWMANLRRYTDVVGYSGHERGIAVSLGAVALGARIIERHITLDRMMEGPDHAASLEPGVFSELVSGIRELEQSLGRADGDRQCSQGELINRENLAKSVVACRNLSKGERLVLSDLDVKSPGQGLSPLKMNSLVGKPLGRDIAAGSFFYDSDLTGLKPVELKEYKIGRTWGIPVRFHDFPVFSENFAPKCWEFHLSYRDLSVDPLGSLDKSTFTKLVVHTPELFENSEILDLCSADKDYRERSIGNVKRVIEVAKRIAEVIGFEGKIPLVTNVGGFSMDAPLKESEKKNACEILLDSLNELRDDTCYITPQTSAPFPWHFGGQRFQNLLLSEDDCDDFCRESGLKICLDVSHSGLAANHFGWDLYAFVERLMPHVDHLHISDFSGVSGEGLQLGEGEINLLALKKAVEGYENVSFIPEIWQGHKDFGSGFSFALQKLEEVGF